MKGASELRGRVARWQPSRCGSPASKTGSVLTAVCTGWGRVQLGAGPGLTQTGHHRTGV